MKTLHTITATYDDLVFIGASYPCPECHLTRMTHHHSCTERILKGWTQYCECPQCYSQDHHHYGVSGDTIITQPDHSAICVYCLAGNHPTPP